MTLVYRCPKLVEVVANQNPGPGAYAPQQKKHKNVHPSPPFISKVEKSNRDAQTQPGPSTYFRESFSHEKKSDEQLAVFKSKIERFGSESLKTTNPSKQKVFAQQFNQLMKRQKNENTNKGKLIDIKLKRQIEQKINNIQNLPSIPSQEHSFGYRFDDQTNKLIYNNNPKIIFTQNVQSTQKQHFYFQRQNHLDPNPRSFLINTNSKRPANQLTHQLSNPTFNSYNSQQYFTIMSSANKLKKSNPQSSITHYSNNSPNKKQLLTLQLSKKFKHYINEEVDLNKLQEQKYTNKSQKSLLKNSLKKESSQIECFLSRQSRFEKASKRKEGFQPKMKDQVIEQQGQERNRNSIPSQPKKKQPFQLGSERFKPRDKEALGPGVYNLKETTFQNGGSMVNKEQRFKTHSHEESSPGPGSYEMQRKNQQKQVLKCPFNKYRNVAYFHQVSCQKQNTMENLYHQVGKHMNYLNKIQKNRIKNKENNFQRHKKDVTYLSLERISQAKRILKEKIEEGKQKEIIIESPEKYEQKFPKFSHLYHYNKPQQITSELGPGCYEIRSTLDKKTFNKTVKA